MTSMRSLTWIACALAAACAHPPPPLHSTRLAIAHEGGNYQAFIRAKVAGEPMLLLIDTGAVHSILPEWFVVARNLKTKSLHSATQYADANGNVAWMPDVPNVPVQFEGEETGGTLDFVMQFSTPRKFGILAPQDFVQRGFALVIDVGREDLRYEREEDALKRLRAEGTAQVRELDYHGCLMDGLFERPHRVVSVKINGVSTEMMLDTGASQTVLSRNNPALESMMTRRGNRETMTAMTSQGNSLVVDGVPVEVSESSYLLQVMVHPASQVCGRGALGADLLSHCALVWGHSSMWTACRPQEPGK
jgi:predicted aspartyl protease